MVESQDVHTDVWIGISQITAVRSVCCARCWGAAVLLRQSAGFRIYQRVPLRDVCVRRGIYGSVPVRFHNPVGAWVLCERPGKVLLPGRCVHCGLPAWTSCWLSCTVHPIKRQYIMYQSCLWAWRGPVC
jgi:hypothetical protein